MTAELLGVIAVGGAFLSSIILVLVAGVASFHEPVEKPQTRQSPAPLFAARMPSPE